MFIASLVRIVTTPYTSICASVCVSLCPIPSNRSLPYVTHRTIPFILPHATPHNTTLHTLTHTTKTRSDTYSPRTTHTGAGGVGSATKSREDSDGKDDEEKTKMRGDSAAALQHQYHLPSLSLSVFCRTFVTCFDRRFHFIVKIILLPVSYRVLHFFRMSF
jgi:hypothetical protein